MSDQAQQNIRVAVRCRPLNKYEKENNAISCVSCSGDKVTIRDRNTSKVFTFDQVFGPFSKQIDVFQSMVSPAIDEVLQGYNCTIFAYGQTGSGKTFTMTGERSDKLRYAWEDDPMVGIIPRALSSLFENLEKMSADFSVRVSFLEIYNEELFDLLSAAETNKLTIYDDVNRKGSVIVKGLREVVVLNKENVHSVIERGLARRQTASTLLNAQSSRSHSIFTVTTHIKEIHPISGEELLRIGKLHLVDLAGSENIARSGAIERRAREAGSINQSLLTLGRVITALIDHASHVPYRESKLTRLLQDSLGGKTKTSIIATINPSSLCMEDTLSTLDYAHRAKNIKNRPEVNIRLNKVDLVRGYNEELERLRRDLEAARTKTGIFVDVENYHTLQTQIKQQRERICELEERREMQENEMNQLQDLFTMTQSELAEAHDRQQQITNELQLCQSDLEEKQLRLLKLKFRLEEEEHLRRQHERTEQTLRQQAADLLTTAQTAIGDVNTLHDKVNRLTELDKSNRDRLSHLVRTWTVDRLSDPAEQLSQLAQRFTMFCQQIQSSISELRTRNETLTSELRRKQHALKNELAQTLASECIRSAEQTERFAREQSQLSKQCLNETLRPQSERISAAEDQIDCTLQEMCTLVENHNLAFEMFSKDTTDLLQQSSQILSQTVEFVAKQQQSNLSLRQSWESHCTRRANLIEILQNTINDLNAEHQSTQNEIVSRLTADSDNLSQWSSTHEEAVTKFQTAMSDNHKHASEQQKTFYHNATQLFVRFTDNVKSVRSNHQTLQSEVHSCLDRLCGQASEFSHRGLGAELRQRAELWTDPSKLNTVPEEVKAQHASVQLDALTRGTEDGINAIAEANTEKALGIENLSGNVSYEVSTEFAHIQDNLQSLPTELESQLSSNLQPYSPTGRTPQPKSFSYPDKLAQTASHTRLRRAFRAMQLEPGLEQLLTPLAHDRSMDTIRESDQLEMAYDEENRTSSIVDTQTRGKIVAVTNDSVLASPARLVLPEDPGDNDDAPLPSTPVASVRQTRKKKLSRRND